MTLMFWKNALMMIWQLKDKHYADYGYRIFNEGILI